MRSCSPGVRPGKPLSKTALKSLVVNELNIVYRVIAAAQLAEHSNIRRIAEPERLVCIRHCDTELLPLRSAGAAKSAAPVAAAPVRKLRRDRLFSIITCY